MTTIIKTDNVSNMDIETIWLGTAAMEKVADNIKQETNIQQGQQNIWMSQKSVVQYR